jgi:hypothetical protein
MHLKALIAAALISVALISTPAHARRKAVTDVRALPPSRQSLIDQNTEIDRLGLPRIKTEAELRELVRSGELAAIPGSRALYVHIPAWRAFARPWAVSFLVGLSMDYYAAFGVPLQANSAARPITVQRRLRRFNRAAAPISGECASAHLAGVAIDIERQHITPAQRRWLQYRLAYEQYARSSIIVEEERYCFHLVVRGADYQDGTKLQPSGNLPSDIVSNSLSDTFLASPITTNSEPVNLTVMSFFSL